MIEPLDRSNVDSALQLLARGFPERSPDIWRLGLDKHMASRARDPRWPAGFLLRNRDRWEGVILTLASRRPENEGFTDPIVNVSGWYIDDDARWSAIAMLKHVMNRPAIITDLSAAPYLVRLFHGIGLQDWSDSSLLFPISHSLRGPSQGSNVRPLKDLPRDALADSDRELLQDHERLGCIAAGFDNGRCWRPLIFARRRLKNLVPCAHLIYAKSRAEALMHRRNIGWFLLKRGFPVLRVDANLADAPRFCIARPSIKLFRGDMPADRIDYAYSELVYLGIT